MGSSEELHVTFVNGTFNCFSQRCDCHSLVWRLNYCSSGNNHIGTSLEFIQFLSKHMLYSNQLYVITVIKIVYLMFVV